MDNDGTTRNPLGVHARRHPNDRKSMALTPEVKEAEAEADAATDADKAAAMSRNLAKDSDEHQLATNGEPAVEEVKPAAEEPAAEGDAPTPSSAYNRFMSAIQSTSANIQSCAAGIYNNPKKSAADAKDWTMSHKSHILAGVAAIALIGAAVYNYKQGGAIAKIAEQISGGISSFVEMVSNKGSELLAKVR